MNTAIITAAGSGKRMNQLVNKVFLEIGNTPIIARTIKVFENCSEIDKIVLVAREEDIPVLRHIVEKFEFAKVEKIVAGGKERQDSVYNGIKAIENPKEDDIVLTHNGANPFVSSDTISRCIESAGEFGVAVAGIRAKDTIKEANGDNEVLKTLDRSKLWLVQTPQVIKYKIAKEAFDIAMKEGFYGTDDVMLAERLGYKVRMVESNPDNIKITHPNDINLAENLLSSARVGFGLDSHRFAKEKKGLILGGVLFDGPGLEANSDGDVILHSLFNAIWQSMGGNSIGHYADDMFRNGISDSKEYLKVALDMLKINDYQINNIGVMIECKTPKIDPKADEIRDSIEALTGVPGERIGVTATTGEGLTDAGKGLGIQVFSVVSVSKKND